MNSRMLIVCGMAALLVAGCTAYPTGAPASVCNDLEMEPTFHIQNYSANSTNIGKYTLSSQPVEDNPGIVKVTLIGPTFKGFVVRATTPNEKNLGEFIADANASEFNVMNCASQEQVAVTHVNPEPKPSITLLWKDRNNGNYVFQATVVQNISNYTTNIFEKEVETGEIGGAP